MAHPGDLSELERLIVERNDPRGRCHGDHRQDRGQWRRQRFHPRLLHPDPDGAAVAASEQAGGATDPRNSLRALRRHRRGDEPALQRVLRQRGEPTARADILGACDRHGFQRAGSGRRCRSARPCRERRGGRSRGDRQCRDRTAGRRAFRAGQMSLRDGRPRGGRDRRRQDAAHQRSQQVDGLCARGGRVRRRARARRDQAGQISTTRRC